MSFADIPAEAAASDAAPSSPEPAPGPPSFAEARAAAIEALERNEQARGEATGDEDEDSPPPRPGPKPSKAEPKRGAAPAEAPSEEEATEREWKAYRAAQKELRRKDQLLREREAKTSELEAKAAQAARLEELRSKAKEDPFEVLKEFGLDLDGLVDKGLQRGTPKETESRILSELQRIAEENKSLREFVTKSQEEHQGAIASAQKAASEQWFLNQVHTSAESFPFAAKNDPAQVAAFAWQAQDGLKEELGRNPSWEEIATEIEAKFEKEAEDFFERHRDWIEQRIGGKARAGASSARGGELGRGPGEERRTGPRTTSNALPANIEAKHASSYEERRLAAIRMLEAQDRLRAIGESEKLAQGVLSNQSGASVIRPTGKLELSRVLSPSPNPCARDAKIFFDFVTLRAPLGVPSGFAKQSTSKRKMQLDGDARTSNVIEEIGNLENRHGAPPNAANGTWAQ